MHYQIGKLPFFLSCWSLSKAANDTQWPNNLTWNGRSCDTEMGGLASVLTKACIRVCSELAGATVPEMEDKRASQHTIQGYRTRWIKELEMHSQCCSTRLDEQITWSSLMKPVVLHLLCRMCVPGSVCACTSMHTSLSYLITESFRLISVQLLERAVIRQGFVV